MIVLKELKDIILGSLRKIFNNSIQKGEVPTDFKLANVTPIFKKGDKKLASNYRPISLTSITGKILEQIIRDHIVHHLNSHNLICDNQHGFTINKSCLTNLLEFFDKVFKDYDEHKAVDIIYLDFQKAFDLVPHNKLIAKLKSHGIDGSVLKWIQEWLNNRKQRVIINGTNSEYINVTSGVCQGTVLGPLLFLIYVNDMNNDILNNILEFADDTKLSAVANTVDNCKTLQNDLNNIVEWSNKWGMKLDIDKCASLHIGNNNNNFIYKIGDKNINQVLEQKDLGVIIDRDLKFHKQTNEAIKKANKLLGFISRTFDYKSKDIILPLYKSLVKPHLEYCVQFWSPTYRKDIDALERIQRRATKLIPSVRNYPYKIRLKKLKLQSLKVRRLRGQLIEVFKILNGFDKVRPGLLTLEIDSITRNNGYKLIGNRFRTDKAKNFFTNKIVNVWNLLPNSIVSSTTINQFKNRIDKYFTDDKINIISRVCDIDLQL